MLTGTKHFRLNFIKPIGRRLAPYAFMILLTLLLFGIILSLTGSNPIAAYRDMFRATFGSAYGFSEVLVAMIPLLITSLAVALPWRVGLINIGGEGQLYIGAALATWAALAFTSLPGWLLIPIMMIPETVMFRKE